MAGISSDPTVAVSATTEPFIPAKNMLTRMFTCASPPRTRPISRRLSSTSRSVMVALVISSPVSMKKGIAVSGRLLIASNIWFGTRLSGAASVSST